MEQELKAAIDAVMVQQWSGTVAQLDALSRLVTAARKMVDAPPRYPCRWPDCTEDGLCADFDTPTCIAARTGSKP